MNESVRLEDFNLEDFLAGLLCCEGSPKELYIELVDEKEGMWKGKITFLDGEQVKVTYLESLWSYNGRVVNLRRDTVLAEFEGFEKSRVNHIIEKIREVKEALDKVFA